MKRVNIILDYIYIYFSNIFAVVVLRVIIILRIGLLQPPVDVVKGD